MRKSQKSFVIHSLKLAPFGLGAICFSTFWNDESSAIALLSGLGWIACVAGMIVITVRSTK